MRLGQHFGRKLGLERRDVWDMLWSEDDEEMLCIVEKTKMVCRLESVLFCMNFGVCLCVVLCVRVLVCVDRFPIQGVLCVCEAPLTARPHHSSYMCLLLYTIYCCHY